MLILAALIPIFLTIIIIGCTIGLLRASIKKQSHERWLRGLVLGLVAYTCLIFIDAYTSPIALSSDIVAKSLISLYGMYSLIFGIVSFVGCTYFMLKKQMNDNRRWLLGFIISAIVFVGLNILDKAIG